MTPVGAFADAIDRRPCTTVNRRLQHDDVVPQEQQSPAQSAARSLPTAWDRVKHRALPTKVPRLFLWGHTILVCCSHKTLLPWPPAPKAAVNHSRQGAPTPHYSHREHSSWECCTGQRVGCGWSYFGESGMGGQRHAAGRTWRLAVFSVLLGLVARSARANDINHKVSGNTAVKKGRD